MAPQSNGDQIAQMINNAWNATAAGTNMSFSLLAQGVSFGTQFLKQHPRLPKTGGAREEFHSDTYYFLASPTPVFCILFLAGFSFSVLNTLFIDRRKNIERKRCL